MHLAQDRVPYRLGADGDALGEGRQSGDEEPVLHDPLASLVHGPALDRTGLAGVEAVAHNCLGTAHHIPDGTHCCSRLVRIRSGTRCTAAAHHIATAMDRHAVVGEEPSVLGPHKVVVDHRNLLRTPCEILQTQSLSLNSRGLVHGA